MQYKYHVVYKTTNLVNRKYYVGFHSCNNLEDSYLGSGKLIKAAILKYGKENFFKEIIAVFHTRDAARYLESKLVNKSFVKNENTYNLTEGGTGVESQYGSNNHRYGKPAINRKAVVAQHKLGKTIRASSIKDLSSIINIDRANIRNLIKKKIQGKLGWKVSLEQDIV